MQLSRVILSSGVLLSCLPRAAAFVFGLVGQNAIVTSNHRVACIPKRPMSIASSVESGSSDTTNAPDLPPIDSASKRLFLVRHGEVINPGGDRPVYYGAMDVSLSPLGEEEAQAAAVFLQQFDLEYVVSSPLARAVYGAQQVLEMQSTGTAGKGIVTSEGFMELDRGDWCGKTKDEIGDENMARFDACDESVTPNGGESYPFVKQRVLAARDQVLNDMSGGRAAAIVSHLQVTRCMLSDALKIPIEEMSTLAVATASVTCIDYNSELQEQTVHFQSFKPDTGLEKSRDVVN